MARESRMAGGRIVYRPDSIKINKNSMIIRTDIPLMDNVGNMVRAQVSVWLNKYKVYSVSREAMEDLELDFAFQTYRELCRRVAKGLYCREYSLYLNIRSCAWSMFTRVYRAWIAEQKRKEREVSIYMAGECDGSDEWIESISSDNTSALTTRSDEVARTAALARLQRNKTSRPPKPSTRKPYTMNDLPNYIEDSWDEYLEACYDTGIPVRMTKEEWVTEHYPNVRQPKKSESTSQPEQ